MRDTTRRELLALRRRVTEALDSRKRREPEPIAAPPAGQTRGDWFARELGDAWVEVEPGIYERAA